MSTTGNSTYTKSMNGIITFDDGAGTVIEDGVISTTNITTGDVIATSVTTDDITTDNLTVSTALKTNNIESILTSDSVYIYESLDVGESISIGAYTKTVIGSSCVIDSGSVNLFNDTLTVTSGSVYANTLKSVSTGNTVNLYTNTTGIISLGNTGKVKLGSSLSITDKTIASTNATDAVNILTATTGAISIGSSGQINVGNSVSVTDKTIATSAINDTVNLFNNITTGVVNMAKFAIKKNQIRGEDNTLALNLFDDHTGVISMCNGLRLFQNEIDCSTNSTTYRLFDTITTGAIYLGAGLSTGSCNIASTLSTGTLNLGNTLGAVAGNLGNIVMGNGLNSTTTTGNGIVQINKLKVGLNGTPYRYMIMANNIGNGLTGIQTVTITGAPSNMGNPIVLMNYSSITNQLGNIYVVNTDVTGTNTFRYRKRVYNGSTTADTTEPVSYVAYWI